MTSQEFILQHKVHLKYYYVSLNPNWNRCYHGTRCWLRICYTLMKKNGSFRRKNNPICDWSRPNKMPYTEQIIKFAPYMRTYFCVIRDVTNYDMPSHEHNTQCKFLLSMNKICLGSKWTYAWNIPEMAAGPPSTI